MLTLSRRDQERLYIRPAGGGEITVVVSRIDGKRVILAIDAPKDCEVWRAEIDPKRNNLAPEANP